MSDWPKKLNEIKISEEGRGKNEVGRRKKKRRKLEVCLLNGEYESLPSVISRNISVVEKLWVFTQKGVNIKIKQWLNEEIKEEKKK